MIDHVSVGVSDLERAARFYELALAPLGLSRLVTRPATVGFGKSYPEFWINLRTGMPPVQPGSGVHICLGRKSLKNGVILPTSSLKLSSKAGRCLPPVPTRNDGKNRRSTS